MTKRIKLQNEELWKDFDSEPDPEIFEMNPECFEIPANKIPRPELCYLTPWWFRSGDGRIMIFDDKYDIEQALMKSVKQEYSCFGFRTWNDVQTGDTGFREKMNNFLKKPIYFNTGKEAYDYIVKYYSEFKKDFIYIMMLLE